MAFWSRWFKADQKAYGSEELWRDLYARGVSSTGIDVNWKSALQCEVAFACARVIAQGLSGIPFRLMRAQGNTREPASEHRLYGLLEDAPNDFMTSVEMFDTIGLHLVFCGNAYLIKNNLGRDLYELIPVEPGKVTVSNDRGVLSYKVSFDDRTAQTFAADRIWHIRGPSWNGWMGLEGVALAREAIGLSLAAETHGASTFSNGAQLGGFSALSRTSVLNRGTIYGRPGRRSTVVLTTPARSR